MTLLTGRDRLVVALDFPDRPTALAMFGRLRGEVGMFKIGKQLFTAEGPALVREIVAAGEHVFLDLKFHDIPNTVAGAVAAAAGLGVSAVTIHASGGPGMIEAAVGARAGSETRLFAVTVLTSLNAEQVQLVGFAEPPDRLALRLARLAIECGADGVVASPAEVALLRRELGPDFLILTPGIRPAGSELHDQARVATPQEAIRNGADLVVVGRPITQAPDPVAAARTICRMLH